MSTQQQKAARPWFQRIPGWAIAAIVAVVVSAALGTAIPMVFGGKTAADVPVAPVVNTGEQTAPSPSAQVNSTTIERPAPPVQTPIDLTFQGRTAPSASFPLSDEKYVEAGRRALSEPRTQESLFKVLGNPTHIDVIPVEVREWMGYLYVYYKVTAHAPERSTDTPPFLEVRFDRDIMPSVIFTNR